MKKNSNYKKTKIGLYFQCLSKKGGGAEKMLIWLANALHNKNYEIHLYSWDHYSAKTFYDYNQKIKWHRLKKNDEKVSKFEKFIRLFNNLRKNKIQIIIGFVMSGDGTLYLASLLNSVKIISAERNEPAMYNIIYSKLRKKINFFLLGFSKTIVLQQREFIEFYPKSLLNKIKVIENPVFSNFNNKKFNFSEKIKTKNILYVGRLERIQKRPIILLKSFNLISQKIPAWNLVFVGDGQEYAKLLSYIKKYKLVERVKIINTTLDLPTYYKNSSVLVIPSLWEGFPNVVGEAISFGLACIGFEESLGVKALLKDNRGWLVKNSEPKSKYLAKTLLKCINNKDERIRRSKMAFEKIKENEPDKILQFWIKLINDI